MVSTAARAISARLSPLGYRRRGIRFVRQGRELISRIELQIQRGSTTEEAWFAVNYGVVVVALAGSDLPTPTHTDCHWGARVCGEDGVERWWRVRDTDHPDELANRLLEALEGSVLQALDTMQTEADLIALWKTGRSPLLVEAQRLLFLGMLLCRAGRKEELEAVQLELESKAHNLFAVRALERLKALQC